MNIDEHLLIAIIASLLNILLSLIVPTLLKKSTLPFADQIKKNYECNKEVILVSSVMTIIFVFVSLKITPFIKNNFLSNVATLNTIPPLPNINSLGRP